MNKRSNLGLRKENPYIWGILGQNGHMLNINRKYNELRENYQSTNEIVHRQLTKKFNNIKKQISNIDLDVAEGLYSEDLLKEV